MATNEVKIPIPARLYNAAEGGHVAGADEIIDDNLSKDQQTINAEVNAALGEGGIVDEKIADALEDVAFIDDSSSSSAVVPSFDPESQTVHVTAQTLSEQQKAQVRTNIGLGDVDSKINEAVASEASQRAAAVSGVQASVNAEATRAQAAEADRYTKSETYTKTEVNGLVDTPHQEYMTVATYAELPATGSKDTIYRVSNYNGSHSQVAADVYSEYAWNGSQYIFLCVKSQIGEVFDISVYNNNAKYADLAAALNGGANIPQSLQKGGMSVKFVQSSDNKYVQYRLMSDEWSTSTEDWAIADEDVYVDNPEYIEVTLDGNDRILYGVTRDGDFIDGKGNIQKAVEAGKKIDALGISIDTEKGILTIGGKRFKLIVYED